MLARSRTSDFPEQDAKEFTVVMQAKGSESHAPIEDHLVEVSAPVAVPSSLRLTSSRWAQSLADSTTPINTPIDGHHVEVSAIVTVPSLSPYISVTFSSLDGLETTDVGDDPYIGTSTTIVEFTYDHITVENQVDSKFWTDPKEMEEDVSDTGEEIVRTKRKPGKPPKGTGKSKKTAKKILSTTSQ